MVKESYEEIYSTIQISLFGILNSRIKFLDVVYMSRFSSTIRYCIWTCKTF